MNDLNWSPKVKHFPINVGTAAGNCYFRDGKFVPVPESALPNNNRFYYSPTGNLWLYDKN